VTTLLEAGSRTLKNIDTLEVRFQRQVRGWLNEMVASKITPLIYCGRRTMEEQAGLYAKGRTKPGKIVTKAKPGQSYHNYGLAFDWVPLKATPKNKDLYMADWSNNIAYKLGEKVGVSFELAAISWETGHLQTSKYATWRDIPQP
jgi:hypothetical protein